MCVRALFMVYNLCVTNFRCVIYLINYRKKCIYVLNVIEAVISQSVETRATAWIALRNRKFFNVQSGSLAHPAPVGA
jgi:uncharacterized protein (UPF0332 family)